MLSFASLEPFDKNGRVRMVVETPRGSSIKFKFDEALGGFTVSRTLALGITYPFDWGFIPGTMSDDGDALDAMCLSPLATFPGAVLPCRAIAALQINQKGIGSRVNNPRVILAPDWDGARSLGSDLALDAGARSQIEQFFVNATLFTDKDASVGGWLDADRAERLIRKAVSARNQTKQL